MIIPVFLFLCDHCEARSAMTSREDTPPGGWENYDGHIMCPECVVKSVFADQRREEKGVALTIVERCP